ncbi:hypothetical protein SVAN01_01669 [Stagonosporopsis vannaccii]|nr:hypothetical protein SVAN01_01669 [Stagonosporopsis vannaccii]
MMCTSAASQNSGKLQVADTGTQPSKFHCRSAALTLKRRLNCRGTCSSLFPLSLRALMLQAGQPTKSSNVVWAALSGFLLRLNARGPQSNDSCTGIGLDACGRDGRCGWTDPLSHSDDLDILKQAKQPFKGVKRAAPDRVGDEKTRRATRREGAAPRHHSSPLVLAALLPPRLNPLYKHAVRTTTVVFDVDAGVDDRATTTCGGPAQSRLPASMLQQPSAQCSMTVSPSLSVPLSQLLGRELKQSLRYNAPAPCACADSCHTKLVSCQKQAVSNYTRVECRRHGIRRTAHIAGQAGSIDAPSMRTVGGRLDQTLVPATSDRWPCTSLAASGAKPTVRSSFDPNHHMESFSNPTMTNTIALILLALQRRDRFPRGPHTDPLDLTLSSDARAVRDSTPSDHIEGGRACDGRATRRRKDQLAKHQPQRPASDDHGATGTCAASKGQPWSARLGPRTRRSRANAWLAGHIRALTVMV